MKYFKNWLILTIAALLFSSCERLISEIEAPQSEPKLVIYSVISPQDSIIEVKVKKSNPLFSEVTYQWDEERFPAVINATVILSGEGQSVTIPYNEAFTTYRINRKAFNITPGGHYELKVMVQDFIQISAECTVPEQTPPDIEITGTGMTEETGMMEWYFEFRFKDLPGIGHNYLVNVAITNYDPWMEETYNYFPGFKQGNYLVSDKTNDDGFFNYRTYPIVPQYMDTNNIWVSLSLVDENYYQYAQSVDNFQNDNPFSEPTPIYSNIEGGLGVFAGINTIITEVPTELP